MSARLILMSLVLLVSVKCSAPAQIAGGGGDAHPGLKTNPQTLKNWQEMRFGMFIHCGPVSLTAYEISFSRGRETPIAEYSSTGGRSRSAERRSDGRADRRSLSRSMIPSSGNSILCFSTPRNGSGRRRRRE